MTEPPKDYEEAPWSSPRRRVYGTIVYDRDRTTEAIAILCLLSAIGGFLIGWSI